MKRTTRNLFRSLVCLIVILTMAVGLLPSDAVRAALPSSETTITIFHTNDVHGKFIGNAEYVKGLRDATPNSLLVDGGDATQGVAIASYSKGASIIKIMNAVGYDAMVLGNHEFDYGATVAKANAGLANFPVLSANTLKDGQPFLAGVNGGNGCNTIKEVAGIKVGFFGITTHETAYKTNPSNLQGITFADEVATTKDQIAALKAQGADVIVGIMHVGIDPSSDPTSIDIANALPANSGLDIIIDGHSHSAYIGQTPVNGITIAQAKTGFDSTTAIGKLTVTVDSTGVTGVVSSSLTLAQLKQATPDQTVKDLGASLNAALKPTLAEIVGRTDVPLWGQNTAATNVAPGGNNAARLTETNLGDLVADSMVWGAKKQLTGEAASLPVVSLANGGGIRISIPSGLVTVEDINAVLPFGNSLAFLEVTPDVLFTILENSVSSITKTVGGETKISGADGRFGQIGGMRFEYDASKYANSRVTKVFLLNDDGTDGKELLKTDMTTKIVFVANDFQLGGGDGYAMLAPLPTLGEGGALDVVFADYLRALCAENGGTLNVPESQGRITEVSTHYSFGTTFDATFTIAGSAGKTVTYSVDGGEKKTATAAVDNTFKAVGLTTGAHNLFIEVEGNGIWTYVNNKIGSIGGTLTLVPLGTRDAEKMDDAIAYADMSDKATVKELLVFRSTLSDEALALLTKGGDLDDAVKAFATKSASNSILEDILTGVTLNDKNNVLPNGTILVTGSPSDKDTAALGKLGTLLSGFELSLTDLDGIKYTLAAGETVEISIPLTGEYNEKLLKVVHLKDDGTAEYPAFTVKDGAAVFEATDFSVYAVIEVAAPATGDRNETSVFLPLLLMAAITAAGAFVMKKKLS